MGVAGGAGEETMGGGKKLVFDREATCEGMPGLGVSGFGAWRAGLVEIGTGVDLDVGLSSGKLGLL